MKKILINSIIVENASSDNNIQNNITTNSLYYEWF